MQADLFCQKDLLSKFNNGDRGGTPEASDATTNITDKDKKSSHNVAMKSGAPEGAKASLGFQKNMIQKGGDVEEHLLNDLVQRRENPFLELGKASLSVQVTKNFFKLMDDIEAETA